MAHRRILFLSLVCGASWGLTPATVAQSVSNYAVQVSATVQTNPAQITLSWPADPAATRYLLFRKAPDAKSWGTATTLATNATSYADTNVALGGTYEYRVSKSAANYSG